jgi:hypothetical protein
VQPCDRRISKYVFALVIGLALAATLAAQQQQATPQQPAQQQAAPQGPPPAEQVFKNIQVFKGIPAPQLQPTMQFIAASLGGRAAAEKLTTRVRTGALEAPGGFRINVESYQKAPDKSLVILHTPPGDTLQVVNGATALVLPAETKTLREVAGVELARARRDSLFYGDFDLKQLYSSFRVRGIEKVGDRDAYVVMASVPNDVPERLYFDTQTGLLVRRVQYNDSALGRSPLQTDYEDYREVDGIKRAFVQRQARPDFVFVIKWDSIKHNVPVDDAKFEKPAAPAPAPTKP